MNFVFKEFAVREQGFWSTLIPKAASHMKKSHFDPYILLVVWIDFLLLDQPSLSVSKIPYLPSKKCRLRIETNVVWNHLFRLIQFYSDIFTMRLVAIQGVAQRWYHIWLLRDGTAISLSFLELSSPSTISKYPNRASPD